ncbi:Clavaminate synthase-like protein [Ceraceosorus guamensis]|uniref:Clavaminate synthase-like protein n=1 Tax=Ceraceosorus guamensis TaxID=1522189 RepID=A0A316W721_9BASI|nr:Clavaminate synthase-like protein [Ceraceosorus guamensis]PWN45639.1 Clavaminate synthase-like protein [Ceraceosorus guamensis]
MPVSTATAAGTGPGVARATPKSVRIQEPELEKEQRSTAGVSRPYKRRKRDALQSQHISPHPAGIRPSANAIFDPDHAKFRSSSLGHLSALPDELLLHTLGFLTSAELARLCRVSRALAAYAGHDGSWRERTLADSQGGFVSEWAGNWRRTYARVVGKQQALPPLSSPPRADGLYSDVLYNQWRLANTRFTLQDGCSIDTLPHGTSFERFDQEYAAQRPAIFKDATQGWRAAGWTLEQLCDNAGEEPLQAEAMRANRRTYLDYAANQGAQRYDLSDPKNMVPDESPLYLFDAQLPARIEDNWRVPHLLGLRHEQNGQAVGTWDHDLFGLLGLRRPDYRWVIAGPERSGSGWHKDPNATSAWNAVLSGTKYWLFLPPHVTPPGVYVSADEADVTAPLSIAEWAIDFLNRTRTLHGPQGDGSLQEGRCEAGDAVYVPAGWWHLVVNITESVAFTQNLVSRRELAGVLDFMQSRPEQVSGFKPMTGAADGAAGNDDDDDNECAPANLFRDFCDALKDYDAPLLQEALQEVDKRRKVREGRRVARERNGSGWWARMKAQEAAESGRASEQDPQADAATSSSITASTGFAFDLLGQDAEEIGELPW